MLGTAKLGENEPRTIKENPLIMLRPKCQKFSDQLRRWIRESGYSYYEIMKQTGISDAAISRFMRGERDITLKTADKIMALIEVEWE